MNLGFYHNFERKFDNLYSGSILNIFFIIFLHFTFTVQARQHRPNCWYIPNNHHTYYVRVTNDNKLQCFCVCGELLQQSQQNQGKTFLFYLCFISCFTTWHPMFNGNFIMTLFYEVKSQGYNNVCSCVIQTILAVYFMSSLLSK